MSHPEKECWPRVYDLYMKGNLESAIEICLSEECATSVECQRFAGWHFYNENKFDLANRRFQLAALHGDAESNFGIGCIHYALGEYAKAIVFFQQAADLGYGRACHWVGGMYRDGLGVSPDLDKAINYFRTGSKFGYLVAQRGLLNLENRRYGPLRKILNVPRYASILFRAFLITSRNPADERIADAPNAFKK